tara:strand:- start:248 stop:682 length:435 start_codon:yes stop_codon:yes gene_type:complete
MSFGLTLTIRPRDLAKIARQEEQDVKRGIDRAIGRVGTLGKQIILRRTEDGVGVEGPFKPYTAAYIKRLKNEGKPEDPVDLYNTGQMIRSMQVRQRDSRTAEIYFDNPDAAKKAAFNDRTRPFFGFNTKEEDRLIALFRREIDR